MGAVLFVLLLNVYVGKFINSKFDKHFILFRTKLAIELIRKQSGTSNTSNSMFSTDFQQFNV